MPREIRDKEADYEAIGKPHPQELRHSEWAAGKHGQHPHWSLLYFSIMADDFISLSVQKGKRVQHNCIAANSEADQQRHKE